MRLTPAQRVARRNTSQSRIAKMQARDPIVSSDLRLHALFRPGAARRQTASALGRAASRAA